MEFDGLEFAPGNFVSPAGSTDPVDESAKIIRGVKVCGLESVNTGRTLGCPDAWGQAVDKPYLYTEQALRDAVEAGLYTNARVYCDHIETGIDAQQRRVISQRDRQLGEHFGRLVNVRYVPGDGIRADLEYLESHPYAKKVLESARRMPEQIALSHVVRMQPSLIDGRVQITKIRGVRSVDLIAERPGTTSTLFESAAMLKTPPKRRMRTTPALEDGIMDPSMMGTDTGEELTQNPADLVNEGISDAIMAIVIGEGAAADKLAKIQPLLEQMDALSVALGGGSSGGSEADASKTDTSKTPPAAPPAKPGTESAAMKDSGLKYPAGTVVGGKDMSGQPIMVAVESAPAQPGAGSGDADLRAKLARMEARESARQKLEESGVKVTTKRLDVLQVLGTEAQVDAIAEFKAADGVTAVESGGAGKGKLPPRSGGGGNPPPATKLPERRDGQGFASYLATLDE